MFLQLWEHLRHDLLYEVYQGLLTFWQHCFRDPSLLLWADLSVIRLFKSKHFLKQVLLRWSTFKGPLLQFDNSFLLEQFMRVLCLSKPDLALSASCWWWLLLDPFHISLYSYAQFWMPLEESSSLPLPPQLLIFRISFLLPDTLLILSCQQQNQKNLWTLWLS